MDMDNEVCRACGEPANVQLMQDLTEFSDIYFNLTSITVYKSEDGSGPKVCDGCRLKLQQFDQFRSLCIRVHEHLLQNADGFPSVHEPEKDAELSVEVKVGVISSTDDPEDLWNTPFANDYVEFCQPIDYEHLKVEAKTVDQPLSNDEDGRSREEDNELQSGPDRNDSEKLLDSVTVPIKGRGIFLFVCHVCHTKFKTQTRLNGHLRVHQGLKPAVCTICGKEFIKWFNLKMHIRNKHMNEQQQRFPCDFPGCNLTYTTVANMRKHRKTHDPNNHVNRGTLKYICEQCGKSYTTFGALKAHTYSHTGNLPFSCTMCDRKFVNADKLRIHMMRHQGIKNFECPHCGIKKTTKTELRTHINYHTKERKIPCSTCGLAFASSGNLARHVRIVHRGIKEFQCPHCGQPFGKAETLKNHVMTHTGERPHGCTECDKRFIQLVALRKHMKTHSSSRKRTDLAVKSQLSDKE
ncbi:gastrula zinc finger protein XlCGF57.1-like [Anopheles bellator]|uniref:gastrula zinc finger protein XlCGF57.1-like n=1 Tax=Anopheles bellator TaxID=139047 RepID=UPI0026471DEE|nr:gastrula zinc finger protein XlCGF57.1-like [Anopheles bellator]